ncbi:MAG: Yip1 family protein [Lachnospiraceae bacterium]|nr:Yip1 family protein [Lachnospiraceae bacterium]
MKKVFSGILQFFKGEKFKRYLKTLRYSLYVILHPFDGFWDLGHEKRGSLAAANTIVILTLLTHLWDMRFASFMFNNTRWERVNILMTVLGILVPLCIWVVANWSLTTLMDGKGKLKDIYIATAYAFTPYVLIGLPMIVVSNIITFEEGVFYTYFNIFALIWCVFLILAGMMMVHDYSFGKGVLSSLCSLLGMAIIIFILLLFFSLISDAIAYFVSLFKEISFRF